METETPILAIIFITEPVPDAVEDRLHGPSPVDHGIQRHGRGRPSRRRRRHRRPRRMNRRPQTGRDPSLSWLMSGPSAPLLIPVDEIEARHSSPCAVHGYDPCPPRTPPLPSPTPAWEAADLPPGLRPFRRTPATGECLDPPPGFGPRAGPRAPRLGFGYPPPGVGEEYTPH
ncbi:hypothetical protein GUJ93_ZPchr0007g5502 [Zizania palustris]|uniref:Uncharacterized protein n=1 Tax=Zizania palustris TaxID=103762 RepID=A0A8J5S0X5_ZIZPA|nr:hypothetical protein GUJ93_ZPchr0002g23483 [Zizania palustris]KAG8061958.1 hypothetical protein GUJ93_ZPchr0003g17421 [Zizania palustris]KAG8079489.1 hypothetical protein GUJ93_ZPchr0007g5502 [Zizania palustris]